ncbi:eukaryotic translation initiation factor 4B3 isoform X2 [Carica papaya]|uniref:eukaryotic translation initiation factor 4B3 isoform X2 n=1 Tax=Carica papaya TaxID=3649 RepID=UPI000B8C893E|nr:eukaryotic translation initiation factor 4B3 isoform X2 [Carica papaya]
MAATVSSPWGKPGAWALDAEEHEAELLKEQQDTAALPGDFPSLSAAAASKPKKKNKGQTLSLGEFTTYGSSKPSSQPDRLTHDELLSLPTGPRQRSAEELDRSRLGGGFKSYGRYNEDSPNPRWGSSSRVSDEGRRQGGFNRDAPRESGPSRADEIDNWAAGKKSTVGSSFERRERGGFFESQSKADEAQTWVSNKAPEPRRFGGGFERRGSFDSLSRNREMPNGGGSDSDNWGRKREESSGGGGGGRPKLVLQPRTLPVSNGKHESPAAAAKPRGMNPFGDARPREEVLAEKGKDWKEIDEKLAAVKIKDSGSEKGDGAFGKRSFGMGSGRQDDRVERSWRKNDSDTDAHPERKN